MRALFNKGGACLKVAFVAGLSDKKLIQKLDPLTRLNAIQSIHLYRRNPIADLDKITWQRLPKWAARYKIAGDLLRFLCLMVRGWQYDVLIGCNQAFHGMSACICGALWHKPVLQIVTSEVSHVCSHPFLKHTLFSAHAVAVRGPISGSHLKQLGYKGQIEILQNPFRLPQSVPPEHQRQYAYDILAVGDYAPAKSYPWMMEVVGRVKRVFPGLRMAIAGRGPFEKKLSVLLNQYGLGESVSFLGWQNEEALGNLYQNSRSLLLTSKTEGLPMVVIEAMAHKTPVFVTNVGDLSWLVRDRLDGFVVDHGKTDTMVLLLKKGLNDHAALEKMGESAYHRVCALASAFDPHHIVDTWKALLKNIHSN